jgi:hypothetical protein
MIFINIFFSFPLRLPFVSGLNICELLFTSLPDKAVNKMRTLSVIYNFYGLC